MSPYSLKIAHLYPNQLNLYGDRGNVVVLMQRCLWRGIQAQYCPIGPGDAIDPSAYDLFFMGGGQDAQQQRIVEDFCQLKKPSLMAALQQEQAVMLGICGGYQLMGHYYQPHNGAKLPGLGVLDVHTIAGPKRMIGNVVVNINAAGFEKNGLNAPQTLVGFENHSGQTFLGPNVQPLGTVNQGAGNNGQDGTEGAVMGNLVGTYLHGPLLPKNPWIADWLITQALQRHSSQPVVLSPLQDDAATKAHQKALLLKY